MGYSRAVSHPVLRCGARSAPGHGCDSACMAPATGDSVIDVPDRDEAVRLAIYRTLAGTGQLPSLAGIA